MTPSQTSAPVGHTAGPWDQRREYDLLRDEIGVRGRAIAVVWVRKAEGVLKSERVIRADAELEANARLIAAAPELLAAAERSAAALRSAGVEPNADSDNPLEWLLHETLAAIAKATGAQS